MACCYETSLRTSGFNSSFKLTGRRGFFGRHGGDDDYADQNAERAENGAGGQLFPAQEISYQHGHDGVDVGVSAHLGGRFVMQQPDVGGEADDGAGDDQVQQGEPDRARDGRGVKIVKFAEGRGEDGEKDAAGEHLRGGTHEFGGRQRELARKDGRDGPTDGGEDQSYGAEFVDGRAAEV